MGIPNYFYHVLTNHGNIIKKLYFHRIHNLYLDSNSLVYDSVYEYDAPIENNMIIYELVYNKIINIIETLKPHGITYVSFDGVAPVAKLVQQKQRRYKSNLIKEVLLGYFMKEILCPLQQADKLQTSNLKNIYILSLRDQ